MKWDAGGLRVLELSVSQLLSVQECNGAVMDLSFCTLLSTGHDMHPVYCRTGNGIEMDVTNANVPVTECGPGVIAMYSRDIQGAKQFNASR